jgi:hypothetical protein
VLWTHTAPIHVAYTDVGLEEVKDMRGHSKEKYHVLTYRQCLEVVHSSEFCYPHLCPCQEDQNLWYFGWETLELGLYYGGYTKAWKTVV